MTKEDKDILLRLIQQHKELGISEQIDYQKFYLYSIITHSTAIEDTSEHEDINLFIDYMTRLHCQHLKADIDQYVESTSERMVDKQALRQKMVDKWSIKPSLAEKLVDILEDVTGKDGFTTEQIVSHFGFNATTAKRYLRQLTEFGYLESRGGNKNRTYSRPEN